MIGYLLFGLMLFVPTAYRVPKAMLLVSLLCVIVVQALMRAFALDRGHMRRLLMIFVGFNLSILGVVRVPQEH
jgi:Na+-transporting NADH:ubiquinone oxidoreductase subunit NqrD